MDTDGPAILANISKDIDPKKACETIGVCSSTTFSNVCLSKRKYSFLTFSYLV
jgi:hypothetical protein